MSCILHATALSPHLSDFLIRRGKPGWLLMIRGGDGAIGRENHLPARPTLKPVKVTGDSYISLG